jgi:hypothetical protein
MGIILTHARFRIKIEVLGLAKLKDAVERPSHAKLRVVRDMSTVARSTIRDENSALDSLIARSANST